MYSMISATMMILGRCSIVMINVDGILMFYVA